MSLHICILRCDFNIPIRIRIGDIILNCRDYACQYYLMKVVSRWANMIVPEVAAVTMKTLFKNIMRNQSIWYNMFWSSEDKVALYLLLFQYSKFNDLRMMTFIIQIIRRFLNSLNTFSTGPQSIKFIRCLYVILDNIEILLPDVRM